jgi:hypothetical protein
MASITRRSSKHWSKLTKMLILVSLLDPRGIERSLPMTDDAPAKNGQLGTVFSSEDNVCLIEQIG